MKLNRLIVCVYSVVAIFAMVIYLSGDAMSDPKKDKAKQDNDEFVAPDSETFGESGSDTFSESPTPTFQTGRSKVPLRKAEDIQAASSLPDLFIEALFTQPDGAPVGTSALPGQFVTISVVVKNKGIGPANDVRVDTWKHRPSALVTGPGDFVHIIPSLAPGEISTVSHTFQLELQPGAYMARAVVDLAQAIPESNESNNAAYLQYYVVEVASLQTVPTNQIPLITPGESLAFRATSTPANVEWPHLQPVISCPEGTGEIVAVTSGGKGVTNFTFVASNPDFRGLATISVVCGVDTEGRAISHKDVVVEVRDPSIVGPQTVPGGTMFRYELLESAGTSPQNITWSTDNSNIATVVGVGKFANVTFKNTSPSVLKIFANYSVNGVPMQRETEVVVIQVVVQAGTFETRGQPSPATEGFGLSLLLANYPPKTFVTSAEPGSAYHEFKYKGRYGSPEHVYQTRSSSDPLFQPGFRVDTHVMLFAPANIGERSFADRFSNLEIGFIQHMQMTSGLSRFGSLSNLFRTATVPATSGLDWATNRPAQPPDPPPPQGSPGGKDYWPWYPSVAEDVGPPAVRNPEGHTGVDAEGRPFWSGLLHLADTPGRDFPKFYTDGVLHINSARAIHPFVVRVAARTKDTLNKAHTQFFGYTEAKFTYDARYPAPQPGSPSQITKPNAWTFLGQAIPLSVNITPANILYFSPRRIPLPDQPPQEGFLRWE